jgi:hypothetical protein
MNDEENYQLECNAVQSAWSIPMFRKNLLPLFSESKCKSSEQQG